MKTKFIPIDYDYFDWQEKNYIKIIGRNESGKRICIIDSCPVYLWAILKENLNQNKIKKLIEKIKKIQLNVKGRKTKVEKVEIHEKKFLEKKVNALKIFVTNYKDLPEIANELGMPEIEKRRGYDLGYTTHYIIEKKFSPLNWYEVEGESLDNSEEFGKIGLNLDVDSCIKLDSFKKIKEQKFTPKVLTYDIETNELELGKGEILMISLVGDNFKKVITWKGENSAISPDYIEYVKDEAELLETFVKHIREYSPDFLVGYFSDRFDLPYIKIRAEKFNVKLPLGLDNSQPKFNRGNQLTGKIKGIVHIDLIRFIRTAYAQYMKTETLSLNEVAKEFLGNTKKEWEHTHSSNVKNWNKYFEYNLHDSQLVKDLFHKFWPDMLEFTKTIEEPIFDLSRAGLSKYTENFILHNLNKYNEIPEKRPTYNEIGERKKLGPVKGAFVYEPKPGLYDNIVVFDFTSMHTSIIISMNLSKGTLLEKPEKNIYISPEIELDGKKQKFYFTKKPGFFPELLKDIFQKRKKYKEEYKKNPNPFTYARSNAFKVLSASAHGYIGFFGARYYSHETSASILAFVRKFQKEIVEKIEKTGHKIIFGDTDSAGYTREKDSEKQTKELLDNLNKELPGVMKLELDGLYKRGIWVTTRGGTTGAKKKYALIDKENKLKIRGFETVRRDWCKLSRNLQNNIIKLILQNGNEKKALDEVKKIIKNLKERKIEKENLMIKTQLKKPISEYKSISPHVVAAKKMEKRKIPVSQGNLIEYYIAETNTKSKLIRDKVKLPDEKGKYDIEYYLNRQILSAVENIFQVFKINIKEIIEGKKQTTLGDF